MDEKTYSELRQYARELLGANEPACIKAELTLSKIDGSDVELHELDQFVDALIDLIVKHGLKPDGMIGIMRGDLPLSVGQEIG